MLLGRQLVGFRPASVAGRLRVGIVWPSLFSVWSDVRDEPACYGPILSKLSKPCQANSTFLVELVSTSFSFWFVVRLGRPTSLPLAALLQPGQRLGAWPLAHQA